MRKWLALGAILSCLPAQAVVLDRLDAARSRITFTFRQMNVPVEGSFSRFDAQISVDPAQPERGKVTVNVDIAGIDTGSDEGNDAVRGSDWFNTAAFPGATFSATAVRTLGGGRYEARGLLTIKGIRREIATTFTLRPEGAGQWVEGGFSLPRLQFRIGEGEWADTGTVADAVQVKFKLFLTTRNK